MPTPEELQVPDLGPRTVPNPLALARRAFRGLGTFVPDGAAIPVAVERDPGQPCPPDACFEKAGPREMIYFDPARTRAAIVTCGGLCPGLNNVIRSVFFQLYHGYGVQTVLGIRYGYQGMDPRHGFRPLELTTEIVSEINKSGGTILGSSRGPVDAGLMVEYLDRLGVNLLFCVGGDGTQRGALKIHEEARRRSVRLAVVGIPKTIDNDIQYVWRTFGYNTALEEAREVIDSAHNEARGAVNGIGLVKLMGRESGFIAAGAALASQEVNLVLIPEVPFALEGSDGILAWLKWRLLERGHAVIVVAEGAGQHLFQQTLSERDASGNIKFHDIGVFLKDRILDYFRELGLEVNLKYIDPSYNIRSRPANCYDALLCDNYARNAVHAAMAGKSGIVVGYWYNVFTHLPIPVAVNGKRLVSPSSELWTSVLAATGQPAYLGA